MLKLVLLCGLVMYALGGKQVTIRNDVPRRDIDGNIVDCHSGNIVAVNGTYYMYGEHYGNTTGFGPSPPLLYPKIVVYTSPDMVSWKFRGFVLSDWPTKPYGTFFTPWVVYNKRENTFVMWFNAYLGGCCNGNFGVAVSQDGMFFQGVSFNQNGVYSQIDGNSIFVDDDNTAYNFYSSISQDHHQSIEKLSPNMTTTTGVNYGLFPDRYVEGGVLFKRNNVYYAAYGSCCCFCRGGSGWIVYKSSSIQGPWTRQPGGDLNCNNRSATAVCGAYGDRPAGADGTITIQAQGIGLSVIPLADGTSAYLWSGERWVSAPHNNPSCPDECQTCTQSPEYVKGHGYSYWTVLRFDANGNVLPFPSFEKSFTLNLPN